MALRSMSVTNEQFTIKLQKAVIQHILFRFGSGLVTRDSTSGHLSQSPKYLDHFGLSV